MLPDFFPGFLFLVRLGLVFFGIEFSLEMNSGSKLEVASFRKQKAV